MDWGKIWCAKKIKTQDYPSPASMGILGCLESGVDEILSVTKTYEAVSL